MSRIPPAALAALAAAASLWPSRASADVPPVQWGAYGPSTQCIAGYRIAVRADEAAIAHNASLIVRSEVSALSLLPEDAAVAAEAPAATIEVEGIGRVTRIDVPAVRREPRHGGDSPARIDYVLPAAKGEQGLRVFSALFDGGAADIELLRRLQLRSAGGAECDPRPGFQPGPRTLADSEPMFWSPVRREGPLYRCQGGIGYEIRAGERLRLRWPDVTGVAPSSRFYSEGAAFTVHGPERAPSAGSRPVTLLAAYAQSMHHRGEEGMLRLLPTRQGDDSEITILFPSGREDAARGLAGRIELIAADDPRCVP